MPERLRGDRARRIAGVVLALLVEVLLVLVLLTLKPDLIGRQDVKSTPVFTMEATDDAPADAPVEKEQQAETPPRETETPPTDTPPAETPPTPPQPQTRPPTDAPPAPSPPPYIVLPRQVMAQADIARPPAPPAAPAAPARRPTFGPVDRGPAGPPDSEVVGRAPNGQPLYAAAWYREPYPEELRGYLSTASGPGYGLIACRTALNWRVEDCVSLAESPEGSNIARSVLAAAWQFKVRPPRVGGEYRVGEWVRIRIDYGTESRRR